MKKSRKTRGGRLAHWALMLALSLTVLCAAVPQAEAAKWMEPYLEQVVDWGVMRGDAAGNLNPDRVITRAEFVVMMNRAFGFTEPGPNSFSDVAGSAWYAQDMAIAKKAGYFNGSAEGLAKPGALVTREQAAAMLGRCLRMKGDGVMNTHFSDNQAIGPWSRGLVQECADMGIIQGYEDGTFRPRNHITRGQMACFLTRALGTRIAESGEQSAGGVYGNLTITTPGVTLKDTTISGNLYLTGGVSLESLVLENVHVMGKIIISGGGEAQKGQSSVVLRNVTAQGLEVDSLMDQFVSIRSEGLTNIGNTTVRTSAFMEDLTEKGLGFQTISLEGNREKTELQLAGNIKEVINRTPNSSLIFGQGTVQKVTVDEKATNSQLRVDNYVNVGELNLDTAGKVTGSGSVSHANINAPGSQIDMLPDTITVRPGITGDINHEIMDNIIAAESSEDPRILSGYPVVRNIAPTNADAVFAGNKKGTIHWGLTARSDGSLNQEELLNPQNYKNKILASGTLTVTAAKAEMPAKLSGLVKDGSYYVSALLTDNRGRHSQVKIAAFTTPDDSVPDFATGYPKAEAVKDGDGKLVIQAQVMPTKDCRLFYALLPKGATAPTPNDFKTGSLAGALGWGQVDIHKNVPHLVARVNNASLKEQTDYDLYLWLNDADNGKSSGVRKIVVRTPDMTPPKLIHLDQTDVKDKSVSFSFAMDEPGTLYWAVVKKGTPFLGQEEIGTKLGNMKIETGLGALKKGNANVNKALTDGTFTVTGLEPQTEYALYYVIKDKAGNYGGYPSEELTPPIFFKTLDNQGPDVEQKFTHDGTDGGNAITPYPDTSIHLVFNESVQGIRDKDGELTIVPFDIAMKDPTKAEELAEALRHHVRLYRKPLAGQPELVTERKDDPVHWTIDYTKVQVSIDAESGEMILKFPYDAKDPSKSALNLQSGTTYYFELEGITDTSPNMNRLVDTVGGIRRLPEFTTIDAQMLFSPGETIPGQDVDGDHAVTEKDIFDMSFKLTPQTAASVDDEVVWDMLIWSEYNIDIQVWYRNEGETEWKPLGGKDKMMSIRPSPDKPDLGQSLTRALGAANTPGNTIQGFEKLNQVKASREYGIVIKSLNGSTVRDDWSGSVTIGVQPTSGSHGAISQMAMRQMTREEFKKIQQGPNKVKEIGVPNEERLECYFQDKNAPFFINGYPTFDPGDSGVHMEVMLNRPNTTFYYVIAEAGSIPTTLKLDKDFKTKLDNVPLTKDNWEKNLPENGVACDGKVTGNVSKPTSDSIINGGDIYQGPRYVTGYKKTNGKLEIENIVDKLSADTQYVAYFVLRGESTESISEVYAFRFQTKQVDRPVITVSVRDPLNATVYAKDQNGTPREADVKYLVMVLGKEGKLSDEFMKDCWDPTNEAIYDKAMPGSDWEAYKNLTLIEAMKQRISIGSTDKGSVFDLFANKAKQDEISADLESAENVSTTIVKVGNLELRKKDCKGEVTGHDVVKPGDQKYWVVAMGRSPLGSGYAFGAGGFFFYDNQKPPLVTGVVTAVTGGTGVFDNLGDAMTASYTGDVTITFSDALYFRDPNGSRPKQVVDRPMKASDATSGLISSDLVVNNLLRGIQLTHPKQESDEEVTALTFHFDQVGYNSAIVFHKNLSNKSNQNGSVPLTIKLVVKEIPDQKGFYKAEFDLDDGCKDVWDGRVLN